ncbi:MAG: GTPase ObgE [Eubacterium sp.]|nr:GTPase ObgE [Eubacterium sp.]
MFADRARIIIKSGKGGDGHVSFRREKYVPNGGPDGGDGGRGGSIVFEIDPGLNTLANYRYQHKFAAGNGEDGQKRKCHGSDGKDLVLKVPEGTVVLDVQTGKVIADLSGENRRVVLLQGGRGGKGNMHYATPTMQAPRYAQPGQPARELEVRLELKLIADVGLVGFPNVGKSTFLSRVSNAAPKIANYHFTTLVPNLGVVDFPDGAGFVVADIPGLIEGASEGAGLGFEFLRHIERTRMFIHLVDASGSEGRDPVEDVQKINQELEKYGIDLSARKQVIAANKTDLLYMEYYTETGEKSPVDHIREAFEPAGIKVFPISAATGDGIRELLYYVRQELEKIPKESMHFDAEIDVDEIIPVDQTLPFIVTTDPDDAHVFHVEGPRVEKMLGYTNLESEKGFAFFQKFLSESGILDALEEAGVTDGDLVWVYGHSFEYYK